MRFAGVRKLGLALPDVKQGTMHGAPALKVRGHMFACMASHKSAEPNTLVVCVGLDQRDDLIAADPETYYLKDHYVNYPSVLVRLSRIPPRALRELLLKAWRFTASRHKSRARRRPQTAGKRKGALRNSPYRSALASGALPNYRVIGGLQTDVKDLLRFSLGARL